MQGQEHLQKSDQKVDNSRRKYGLFFFHISSNIIINMLCDTETIIIFSIHNLDL